MRKPDLYMPMRSMLDQKPEPVIRHRHEVEVVSEILEGGCYLFRLIRRMSPGAI